MGETKQFIQKYRSLPIQIKASVCFLICGFLQKGISIITTPIFTRILATTEYGQYSVFSSWNGIISVITTLNLAAGMYIQGMIKFEKERDAYSSSLVGLTTTLILLWFVIYICFSSFWNACLSLTTVQMLAMFITIWLGMIFAFWSAAERVMMRYKNLVLLTISASIVNPIVCIISVLYAEDKVTARILGNTVVQFIAFSGLFLSIMFRGKKFFSAKYWKYALYFNLPLIPHYLSDTILRSSDRIMIANIIGNSEAGIYSLAYSVSQIMVIFNTALMQTIEPWLYKKIHEKRTAEIINIAYPTFFIITGVNVLLIALAPEVVSFFAPKEYYEAIYVIPPVAMSVFFMFLYAFFAVFEFYCEKTIYVMISTLTGAVTNIILNFIFIKTFGYRAAGYTTLACYAIYVGMHYSFMKKVCAQELKIPNPYNIRTICLITFIFLAIGFIFLATYDFPMVRYGLILSTTMIAVIKHKMLKSFLLKVIRIK